MNKLSALIERLEKDRRACFFFGGTGLGIFMGPLEPTLFGCFGMALSITMLFCVGHIRRKMIATLKMLRSIEATTPAAHGTDVCGSVRVKP